MEENRLYIEIKKSVEIPDCLYWPYENFQYWHYGLYSPASSHSNKTAWGETGKRKIQRMEIYNE